MIQLRAPLLTTRAGTSAELDEKVHFVRPFASEGNTNYKENKKYERSKC
jgi:hypothetical protein